VICETAEGKSWHWMIPYSLDPVRFHNFKGPKEFEEFHFTGRAHFFKLTAENDKGIPEELKAKMK